MIKPSFFGPDRGRKVDPRSAHSPLPPRARIESARSFVQAKKSRKSVKIAVLGHVGLPAAVKVRTASLSASLAMGKDLELAAATASGPLESAETCHREQVVHPLSRAGRGELCRSRRVMDVEM